MLAQILKNLGFDDETIKTLTAPDIKDEDFLKLYNEKYKVIEDARIADIKKGIEPDLRKVIKEDLEKGLVPETLKKFKKDIAKALNLTETSTKIAESSQEEFVAIINDNLVPKKSVEDQNTENTKLKEKLATTLADNDTLTTKLENLEKEIPVKYVEKSVLEQATIKTKKAQKAAMIKDLPVPSQVLLNALDGKLLEMGLTLGVENDEPVILKDGKPYQNDKFQTVAFDTFFNEVAESLKPQNGGTPPAPAGGGGGGGGGGEKYVSEAQKRMSEEETK